MLRFHNYDDLFIFILTTNTNPAVLRTSDGSIAFSLLQNTTLFNMMAFTLGDVSNFTWLWLLNHGQSIRP